MPDSRKYRALLTGAGGGIGSEIARLLAQRSETLILVGRRPAALDALRQELGVEKTHIVEGDLRDAQTVKRLKFRIDSLGGIDLLINNAGVNDFHDFEGQQESHIRGMIEVNLLAPMLLTQALLPHLTQQARAQIINIGSVLGDIGYPGYAAYCASKFGLRGFSQALRRELLDTSVRVRYFAPRATTTDFNDPAVVEMNQALGTHSDTPQQVAHEFMKFIDAAAWERTLGMMESISVKLNRLSPGVVDGALRRQLPVIRKHFPKSIQPA